MVGSGSRFLLYLMEQKNHAMSKAGGNPRVLGLRRMQ